jgi:NTP pyrophosphatase (non-canonical NTP hydrolase)
MKIVIGQELIDQFVEGFITREEFERALARILNKKEEKILYRRSIAKYGHLFQVDLAIEEMAELTQALCKSKRAIRPEDWLNNIFEEIGDVQMLLDTLKIVFGDGNMVDMYKVQKLERLEKLLEGDEGGSKEDT